jgi:SAM-dependent methyltransferase
MDAMYASGEYLQNNPTWHEEDSAWKAAQITRLMRANAVWPRSICEIGCGTGEILLELQRAYPDARLTGYEISPQAFELWSRKPDKRRIDFHLADIFDEASPHFEVVLVIDVIEHVEDYLGFLKRVRPLGDLKIFHVPLDLSLQSLMRSKPILGLRRNVGHIHYFYKELVLCALRDCGYEILDVCYTASRLELPKQALSSRVMKYPRRLLFRINPDLTVRLLGGYSLLVLAR